MFPTFRERDREITQIGGQSTSTSKVLPAPGILGFSLLCGFCMTFRTGDCALGKHSINLVLLATGAQPRAGEVSRASGGASASRRTPPPPRPDYSVAVYTVKLRRRPPNEMLELRNFDGKKAIVLRA